MKTWQTLTYASLALGYTLWAILTQETPDFPAVLLKAGATACLLGLVGLNYFSSTPRDKALGLILLGLPFCLAGDILLGSPLGPSREVFFIPGLATFLIGYGIFTISMLVRLPRKNFFRALLPALIPALVILFWLELPSEMRIPVVLFTAVQTCFLATALALFHKRETWAVMLGLGASLLYFSDAVIGVQRFTTCLGEGSLNQGLVLGPYFLGMFLIVSQALNRTRALQG